MSYSRRATHAAPNGSGWYESIPSLLKQSLDKWMAGAVTLLPHRLLGIIAPHAGLSYGGATAGKSYAVMREYLQSERGAAVDTIFILGPSHHKGFPGIELSAASQYETPFGPIPVNHEAVQNIVRLCDSKKIPVGLTNQKTDEREHSIELQLPFIASVLADRPVKLVPIIVGFMDEKMERSLSSVLEVFFSDRRNIFVFSSDFCHWGERFGYTYRYKSEKTCPVVADAIEAMDMRAVELLSTKDVKGWYRYFEETENTICGRHPIGVGMHFWAAQPSSSVSLQGYSQSSRAMKVNDSSVSYAAATIYV